MTSQETSVLSVMPNNALQGTRNSGAALAVARP